MEMEMKIEVKMHRCKETRGGGAGIIIMLLRRYLPAWPGLSGVPAYWDFRNKIQPVDC